ncbi:MAG: hypothetical protein WC436_01655 [Candidatus Babeliales bacterium]
MKKNMLFLLALCLGLNFTANGRDTRCQKATDKSTEITEDFYTESASQEIVNEVVNDKGEHFVLSTNPRLDLNSKKIKYEYLDPKNYINPIFDPYYGQLYWYKCLTTSKFKKALKVMGVLTLGAASVAGTAILLDHFAKTGTITIPEWMKKHYTPGQLSDLAKKAVLIIKNGVQKHILTPAVIDKAKKIGSAISKGAKTSTAATKKFAKSVVQGVRAKTANILNKIANLVRPEKQNWFKRTFCK